MGPPFSHRNPRLIPRQFPESPTICSLELIAYAVAHLSPARIPRSVITPFFQRNPSRLFEPGYNSARPTTSPASLIHLADELSPPKVPRSLSTPRSHRKAWKCTSSAKFDWPVT